MPLVAWFNPITGRATEAGQPPNQNEVDSMTTNEDAITEDLHALVHVIAEEVRAAREQEETGNLICRENLQAVVAVLAMWEKAA